MRRALKILLGLLLAGALALALLPWWASWALRPLARAQHVTFERYERVGYARFRLHGVRREDPGVVSTAARVEVDTPLLWAWRTWRGADRPVSVEDWKVEIAATSAAPTAETSAPAGVAAIHAIVKDTFATLTRWLPQATLRRGELRIAGITPIAFAELDWQRGALTARGVAIAGHVGELAARTNAAGTLELHAAAPADATQLDFTWSGAELRGTATWREQPLRFNAMFAEHGWLPANAEIVAEKWSLPAGRARMDDQYARLTGGGKLLWRGAKFELSGEATAAPKEGSKAPTMQAHFAAHGDRSAITITAFDVDAPFAAAQLSAPVTIGFTGPLQTPAAQLTLRADLSKQSWFDATGVIEGAVEVSNAGGVPRETFQLRGDNVRVLGFALHHAEAQGALQWPRLELAKLDMALDAQSAFTARGALDLSNHTLTDVTLRGTLTPVWFQRWLPAGLEWETAEVNASLNGPLATLAHEGTAKISNFRMPPLEPLAATLEWRGHGDRVETVAATFTAGASSLRFAGAVSAREAQVRELQLTQDGGDQLTLAAPTTVVWVPSWNISELRLAGPTGSLALSASSDGTERTFKIEATNLVSTWSRDWIKTSAPAWTVQSLRADGRTTDGLLRFTANLTAQVALESRSAQLTLVARGDADGVELSQLDVHDDTGVLAHAHGRVPVSWSAQRTPQLRLDPDGKLEFEATTQPDSPLWAAIAAPLGLTLSAPSARLLVAGTPGQPTGSLELDIARIAMADPARKTLLPALDGLRVRAHADRGTVVIENVSAAVEGQTMRANGRWPMDSARWIQLARAPATFDWSDAEAEIEIADADLRRIAEGRPRFPLAQGRLQVAAKLARGINLSGSLKLTDATTRPVASLGVLQNLAAELELKGRAVEVRALSAQLGGETVTLTGSADLARLAALRLCPTARGMTLA